MVNKFNKLRLVRERLLIAILGVELIDSLISAVINLLSGVGLFYSANGPTTTKMAA